MKDRVAEAMKGRAEIQAAPDDTARAIQEQRHRSLEARLKDIRLMGDAVIAAFFAEDKPKAREKKRAEVESWLRRIAGGVGQARRDGRDPEARRASAHAISLGDRISGGVCARESVDSMRSSEIHRLRARIRSSQAIVENYLTLAANATRGAHGNADLVAHFFRRAFELIRAGGVFGLIATNTIGQGDTRATGLATILHRNGSIARAVRRLKWPGEAAVIVSVIHVVKDRLFSPILDGRQVSRISAIWSKGTWTVHRHSCAKMPAKPSSAPTFLEWGSRSTMSAAKNGEAESLAEKEQLVAANPLNAERIKAYIGVRKSTAHPLTPTAGLSSTSRISRWSEMQVQKLGPEWTMQSGALV